MAEKTKILLVDDDPDFVDATSIVLESEYDVSVAFDGDEGLAKARAEKPDLIILDIIMPDMDGFTVCEQLKSDPNLADVPVNWTRFEHEPGQVAVIVVQSDTGWFTLPIKDGVHYLAAASVAPGEVQTVGPLIELEGE